MIDAIVNVIDRCIGHLERRARISKETYKEFLAPLSQDFEILHRDYLNSFRRYEDIIIADAAPLDAAHPVLEAIRKDSLYSRDLRAKIAAVSAQNGSSNANSTELAELIKAIYNYLNFGSANFLEDDIELDLPNGPRIRLRGGLRGILQSTDPEEDKRRQALRALESIVENVQRGYFKVSYCIQEIKWKLAFPK